MCIAINTKVFKKFAMRYNLPNRFSTYIYILQRKMYIEQTISLVSRKKIPEMGVSAESIYSYTYLIIGTMSYRLIYLFGYRHNKLQASNCMNISFIFIYMGLHVSHSYIWGYKANSRHNSLNVFKLTSNKEQMIVLLP